MKLYGVTEIAKALQVSQAQVSQWLRRGARGIPEPTSRLACGPVWTAQVLSPWLRKMKRERAAA